MSTVWGITTSRAHLDALEPAGPVAGEINWDPLIPWMNPTDPFPPPPAFAGRYFLGRQTTEEGDAGVGFCLWGHGEGNFMPRTIVPLQRADPERQAATGHLGLYYGQQDANALAQHLDRCLGVGDLEIVGTKQILAFLEVADGTPLSTEYWSAWSTTLHDAVLFPARLDLRTGNEGIQPLLPSLLCAFVLDDDTQTYLPEPVIRNCLERPLDELGITKARVRCFAFWARRLQGASTDTAFGWFNIGEYRQPIPILGFPAPYMQRIPVRYMRWFASLDGWDIADAALRNSLLLVTVDLPTTSGDNPLSATFTATDWRPDAHDPANVNGPLTTLPIQLGVDTASNLSLPVNQPRIGCFTNTNIVVKKLPYDSHAPQTPTNLRKPCCFVFRYYSPNLTAKTLRADEAVAMSKARLPIAVVWEGNADIDHGWAPYVNGLTHPFTAQHGRSDAVAAFTYAAETIHQPPFTPIFFAVDFPIGIDYWNGVKTDPAVPTPPMATIARYFQDVNKGYRDYLATHPLTPYFIGCYGQADLAQALYRAGLASHFWQITWSSWGNSRRPFPHLSVWQVGMFSTQAVKDDNAIMGCVEVDLDVAWGDPGSFVVFT